MITNRTSLKKFILAQAQILRPGWDCSQVSSIALDEIEAFLKNKIKESIHRHPSIGKTYKNFF